MIDDTRFVAPALLVVDMQNDFVRTGAPLEVPAARATFDAHRYLLDAFRKLGAPVVYTKFLATPEPNLLWRWSPQCAPPTLCCRKGVLRRYDDTATALECTDIVSELAPEPQDLIIEKFGYGAFHGTPLSDLLRQRGVRSLVVTGTVTQICVEETATTRNCRWATRGLRYQNCPCSYGCWPHRYALDALCAFHPIRARHRQNPPHLASHSRAYPHWPHCAQWRQAVPLHGPPSPVPWP